MQTCYYNVVCVTSWILTYPERVFVLDFHKIHLETWVHTDSWRILFSGYDDVNKQQELKNKSDCWH